MNFPAISLEKFHSLEPQVIANYLQDSHWRVIETVENHHAIWRLKRSKQKEYSVLLPLDTELPDFANRMYDVVRTLAAVEKRSEAELFNDLDSADRIAKEQQREILNIHLSFEQATAQPEAPAKKLGQFLSTLQDTLDAIGQAERGTVKTAGKISEEITDQTALDVLCTFKGSFGIRLAAAPSKQLELFEDPLAEKVMDNFIALLKSSKDENELRELMAKLQQRAASRYRRFLLSVTDINAKLRVEWGSHSVSKGGTAVLSIEDAWEAIEICDEVEAAPPEQIEIIGELTAINGEQKTFRMRDRHEGTPYFGKISDEVFESGVEPVITKPYKTYKAIIQQTLEEKITGESVMKNKLLSLELIETRQSKKKTSTKQLPKDEKIAVAAL
jgi:CheY-like chemotaxis protein